MIRETQLGLGSAAQMADGHRTVNPAHGHTVGSNPTTSTKGD